MTENVEQRQDDSRPKGEEESASGKTELDTLLTEFDTAGKETQTTQKPVKKTEPGLGDALKALKPVIDYVKDEQTAKLVRAQEQDLEKAFDYMREPEEFKEFPRRWLVGYFEAYSGEHKSFAEAFEGRHENPGAWQAELGKARDAFPEWLQELPGNTVRSDVEAAAAAVNGTTEEAAEPEGPSPVEMAGMSDTEWKRFMLEQRRQAAG